MMETIAMRLAAHGWILPPAAPPVASYVAVQRAGGLLYVSGQLPKEGDRLLHTGRLGSEVSLEQGQAAARLCALHVLAQVEAVTGLEAVTSCVKLTGFIAAVAEFHQHHLVMNGASDLIVAVLGERGRHARSTIGVAGLPLNAPVEVEAIFAV
jgi:enamine deaminase RidA (YjgF/YER057c/UK114 family)